MINFYEAFAKIDLFTKDNILVPQDEEKIRILMMKFNHTRIEALDILKNGLYEKAINED